MGTAKTPLLRIAIYRTSSIGDVVLSSACLELLEKLNVPTEVFWFGRSPSLEILKSAYPHIKTIEVKREDNFNVSPDMTSAVGDLHLIVDLQKNLRSHLTCSALSKSTGAPVFTLNKEGLRRSKLIVKSRLLGRNQSLSPEFTLVDKYQYQMMTDALRRGLEHYLPEERLDHIKEDYKPTLPTEHDKKDRPWRKELRFGNWVAVAPGAAHATKQAPTEVFEAALHQLKTQINTDLEVGLLLVGDQSDRKTTLKLVDKLNWPNAVLNLAGKLSLWETTLAISEVDALLANDTSLVHIAEAVRTPASVLFGPTIEAFGFAPNLQYSKSFSANLGCRPCSKHGKTPCRYEDLRCFKDLKPGEIAQHLLANLNRE